MFSRRKGLFIITTVALLAVASLVRVGQAQKSPPVKTSPGGHAQLKSSVATVGRAVGFAETRPVREIMDQIDQVDRELLKAGREINELNSGFVRSRTQMHRSKRTVRCNPRSGPTAGSS